MGDYQNPIQAGLLIARPGIKVGIIPPGKEPKPTEILAQDKGNIE